MRISVNEGALEITKEIMDNKDKLDCTVSELKNGTTIIDAGIEVSGTEELGRLVSEICLGGFGVVRHTKMHIGDMDLDAVVVSSDHPKIACMGSQYAGWVINEEGYFAMGSGPARALSRVEKKLYKHLDYADDAKVGVILLETREVIADKCGIATSDLYCILAPTACLVGSIQVSARVVEVGMHKLHEIGFDLDRVRSGYGVAPVAPVAKKDARAMGVTNDCILYGGRTFYFVRSDEKDLKDVIEKVPSSSSEQYGQPFYDLFKSVGNDFYKVDPLLFSPAEITFNHIESGKSYHAGELNAEILKQSIEKTKSK
ncbi:MAG: methenyltetrahydromethanopterin cyclohydrolase [Candidatus Thorarchaeota archaeon]|jgi:methenyltetrahydromethanopterin cyclohydrolase